MAFRRMLGGPNIGNFPLLGNNRIPLGGGDSQIVHQVGFLAFRVISNDCSFELLVKKVFPVAQHAVLNSDT